MNDHGLDRNPIRLYRDTEHGWIAGVCAGLADYFGINRAAVRLATILGLMFFMPPVLIAYLAMACILKRKPAQLFRSEREEQFWRNVSTQPNRTVGDLRQRFRAMDRRLSDVEHQVTSEEFDLRQKFKDLGSA